MIADRLDAVGRAVADAGLDGWLLYDFQGLNPISGRLLGLAGGPLRTRRLAVCVTAAGDVRRLVHRIEADALDHIDGTLITYGSRQEFVDGMRRLAAGCHSLAVEYAADAANPYVSYLDAGTADLLRGFGCELASSGDLVQQFEATWTDRQWDLHRQAETVTTEAFEKVWAFIASQAAAGGMTESAVERLILDHFAAHKLLPGHPPIVAVNENSGSPHYETGTGEETAIRSGDYVLVDLWGKLDEPDGIYSDLTRVAVVGRDPSQRESRVFQVVAEARDASLRLLQERFAAGSPPQGWEVDRVGRDVIEAAGFGEFFTHRTGHSIATDLHGAGAHMDDLEIRETRRVIPRTGFSVEPGIYLPGEFGVRSEVNVFIDAESNVHVTGGPVQTKIQRI